MLTLAVVQQKLKVNVLLYLEIQSDIPQNFHWVVSIAEHSGSGEMISVCQIPYMNTCNVKQQHHMSFSTLRRGKCPLCE